MAVRVSPPPLQSDDPSCQQTGFLAPAPHGDRFESRHQGRHVSVGQAQATLSTCRGRARGQGAAGGEGAGAGVQEGRGRQ